MTKKAGWPNRYLTLFKRPSDMLAYWYSCHSHIPSRPVTIRLRDIPAPLLCRSGTTDAAVLWDTFGKRYHLSPGPLPDSAIILDLGANVGYTAVDLAVRYPRTRIFAVELDADNIALAQWNLQPFSQRCTVIQAAVWSYDGEVGYGGDAAWTQHVFPAEAGEKAERKALALTMETLFERFGLVRVDFVKMDIEGAEAEILLPMAPWLAQVEMLKVEVHPPASLETCRRILQASGFIVARTTRNPRCLSAMRSGNFQETIIQRFGSD